VTRSSQPLVPDYSGGCLTNVVPQLIRVLMGQPVPEWMPGELAGAERVVLLVLDGLGWEQLHDRASLAPTLSGFAGSSITSVAPTTTTSCLTSIVTGQPPGVHGVLGYRLRTDYDDVLNLLRWTDSQGDAIERVVPEQFQVHPAFAANPVPVVTRGHFANTGFSRAHLQGARLVNYYAPSSLPIELWRLASEGEQFVYAYYDGIDTIAHRFGFDEHYEAELYTVDRMIRDVVAGLPKGTALVVTADHGQVEVGSDGHVDIHGDLQELCDGYSGEGRFRWLHARPGREDELVEAAREHHGQQAWVFTRGEMIAGGFFGSTVDERFHGRIGDVALVARADVAFPDPTHDGEREMICRHGSLTPAEMLVPLLVHRV
jgi:predicted AlkP superfamily pyrophosphatase or phosphodiesterase